MPARKHMPGMGENIHLNGLTVKVKPPRSTDPIKRKQEESKNVDNAIRALKRAIQNEGLIKEMRRTEYHETKGQKRRRRKAESTRRHQKKMRQMAMMD